MLKQLTLFEQSYLEEFVPAVHWSYNDNTAYYFDEYSINRRGAIKNNSSGLIFYGTKNGSGYAVARLKLEDKVVGIVVHRLVACTFIKNVDRIKYNQVNHIDGNKLNNHILNLEWCTCSENMKALHETNKNQLKLL
jgi:hypothetical protein